MKTAEEYFTEQAYFNKWLKELTKLEKEHIISMMEEYASEQCQKRDEIIEKIESLINEISFAKKHKDIYYAIQGCFDKIDSFLEEIEQLKSEI